MSQGCEGHRSANMALDADLTFLCSVQPRSWCGRPQYSIASPCLESRLCLPSLTLSQARCYISGAHALPCSIEVNRNLLRRVRCAKEEPSRLSG